MKKIVAGITALLIFLLLGTGYGYWLVIDAADELLPVLVKLRTEIEAENWPAAQQTTKELESAWEEVENIWTPLIDHGEVNELENSFTRLIELVDQESKTDALAELAVSKRLVRNVPNTERISIKNIF